MNLNIGDHIVYPSHGAGIILSVSEINVMGRTQNYFDIELLKNGLQVKVPVDHAEKLGLRLITPPEHIEKLLSQMLLPDLELPSAWTPRHRQEQAIMQSGDIFSIAHLAGTLHRRSQLRSLAVTERAIYDEARHMVVSELAVALGLSLKDAQKRTDELLSTVSV